MAPATLTTFQSNNQGFSLIEVMVAIVILMVGLLGLLQTANLAMEQNVKNMFRSEAVRIADSRMSGLKSLPYDNMTANNIWLVPSRLRGFTKNYTMITQTSLIPGSVSKELVVSVRWEYKGYSTSQELRSIRTQ
jgi:type IV pilus assembly protein PilV